MLQADKQRHTVPVMLLLQQYHHPDMGTPGSNQTLLQAVAVQVGEGEEEGGPRKVRACCVAIDIPASHQWRILHAEHSNRSCMPLWYQRNCQQTQQHKPRPQMQKRKKSSSL